MIAALDSLELWGRPDFGRLLLVAAHRSAPRSAFVDMTPTASAAPSTRDEPFESPDLAAAVRSGDASALAAIVERYLPQIFRAARGSGLGAEEAEEVAQETFKTFLEIAPQFEGRSKVRTFLFGILYRKISEARRRWHKDTRHDLIDDVVESRFSADGRWSRPPERADQRLRSREIRRALEECLEASPPNQRMAFYLREVEGLATPELCGILDVTANNLGVLLYRLRNRTRECLEGKGYGKEAS